MKIAFLHDRHYLDYNGGAELTTKYWYEKGISQGHDITLFSCNDEVSIDYDFYLIGNHIDFQNKQCFKEIVNNKKYGLVVHNSNPMSHLVELYEKAHLIIWIAPDQHLEYKINHKNTLIKPCYIDHSQFYNMNQDREDIQVYIGEIAPHKVTKIMLNEMIENQDQKYHLYGSTQNYPDYVRFLDQLPNVNIGLQATTPQQVNLLYNRYKTFFWKLDRYGSFGRTNIEAMLAGCEMNVNKENFGLFKYDINWDSRDDIINWLENELNTFWQNILDKL